MEVQHNEVAQGTQKSCGFKTGDPSCGRTALCPYVCTAHLPRPCPLGRSARWELMSDGQVYSLSVSLAFSLVLSNDLARLIPSSNT